MKAAFSKIILVVACLVALLTLAATLWWLRFFLALRSVSLHDDKQWAGWDAIGFIYLVAPVLGGGSPLALIPCSILFFRRRDPRDLWSLCLLGGSLLSLTAETIALFYP